MHGKMFVFKGKQQYHPEVHLQNGTNADSLLPLISSIVSARQKTHFFREPVLPRLVISGLIINTG
ncbi:MAG: hypothetical protein KZQ59_05045, partial [Candidatus Thiodiazotropha sp. (ex Lucinoma aequizonata)]|nr:hypothetical protein [Candidatus Thiodiazotropha sp. (ex Lucinoma aequizonata)]MCU7909208.1 hypothetical protein [Candidatus Thiodiazotropha sp. (ex Lucinoma aequizonata)]